MKPRKRRYKVESTELVMLVPPEDRERMERTGWKVKPLSGSSHAQSVLAYRPIKGPKYI
jgi:hypothetical protein